MNVYLINLDGDTDRLASADRQLRQAGVPYERIPAVLGRDVKADERAKLCSSFRWWAAVGRAMTDGELGCALSHQKVYERMIRDGADFACVLEDDVVLGPRFGEFIKNFSCRSAESPEVYLLSDHRIRSSVKDGTLPADDGQPFAIEDASGNGGTAEAYCLNLAASKFLRRMNSPVMVYADAWSRWARLGLRIYYVHPTLATQDQVAFGSSTIGTRKTTAQMGLFELVAYKACRVLGKAIDLVLRKVTKR